MKNKTMPILMGIISFGLFILLQNILRATDAQGFILVGTIVICINIWGVAEYVINKVDKK
ncbi:hypothetical protein ACH36K_15120 [Clostridium sp. MB05]|uniref:hypothetical protein n=1 Tax=Clostridium sp. MB05 TaxID=3376682 RepID=UPI00398272B9